MNKKAIRVFSLILYLLLAATLLSTKVQEEMTTLVKGAPRNSSRETGEAMTVDWRAIYESYNEETEMWEEHLYEVREGTGWNQGMRSYDLEGFGIDPIRGKASITLNRDLIFVRAASRQPVDGKLAKVVEEFQTVDDTYLYYYVRDIPAEEEWDLPSNLEVIARSEDALLTAATDVESPFLPLFVKAWTIITDYSESVYSMTETELFFTQLPGVALAFVALAAGILFWALGCAASLGENRKGLVWFNALAAAASLAGLAIALRSFDLPASVLPRTDIFDLAHYREEFTLIFDNLREMGLPDHAVIQAAAQAKAQCIQILRVSGVTAGVVVILEIIVFLRGRRAARTG